MSEERWAPCPGHPDYEASSLGRIGTWRPINGKASRPAERRILKPLVTATGYLNVSVPVGKHFLSKRVHRLVLEAFVGARPENKEACHANGNRADNRLENLRWDTKAANWQDMVSHGTAPIGDRHWARRTPGKAARGERHGSRTKPEKQPRGESCGLSKVSDDVVRSIRAERRDKMTSYEALGAKHGLSGSSVQRICMGKTWGHVDGESFVPEVPRTDRSWLVKLTRSKADNIRFLRLFGATVSDCARWFGTSGSRVSVIANGKCWI